jgi:endonuclease-3
MTRVPKKKRTAERVAAKATLAKGTLARLPLPRQTLPRQALPRQTLAQLRQAHPEAHCELDHRNPFELIVATVLSAQTTDVNVNRVTPELFVRWPTAAALAAAPIEQVEQTISRIGMYRQKAKNIVGLARQLMDKHQGKVPQTLDELIELPGVGRKTANVVLGVAFNKPEGVVVDTHVQRISQRLGWTKNTTPEKIEQDLMGLFDRKDWDILSHTLIFHGRRICSARKPACMSCPVSTACPSAYHAEQIGRKAPRVRMTGKRTRKRAAKSG